MVRIRVNIKVLVRVSLGVMIKNRVISWSWKTIQGQGPIGWAGPGQGQCKDQGQGQVLGQCHGQLGSR
jgi:hypothetical protein